jgi:arginine decarboxylase
MSRCCSNERKALAASVGCAILQINRLYGYISEHHAYGLTEKQTGDHAEDLAAAMLASTLGIDFNVDESWDEKKKIFKISGKIVRTLNVTSQKYAWIIIIRRLSRQLSLFSESHAIYYGIRKTERAA